MQGFAYGEGGDGSGFFVGIGGIGLIVAAVLFFTDSGPFQKCVQNGMGAKFCGEHAQRYCRDVSDPLAGRTLACNEIMGESKTIGAGMSPGYQSDAY